MEGIGAAQRSQAGIQRTRLGDGEQGATRLDWSSQTCVPGSRLGPCPGRPPALARDRLHLIHRQDGCRALRSVHSHPLPPHLESPPQKVPQMPWGGAPRRALPGMGGGRCARGAVNVGGWGNACVRVHVCRGAGAGTCVCPALAQPLWKALRRAQNEGQNDPMIQQLHRWYFSKGNKTTKPKAICTPMFTAAPFPVAETGKQPKCPPGTVGEEGGAHTVRCHSAPGKKGVPPSVGTWTDLKDVMLRETSRTERQAPRALFSDSENTSTLWA